MPGAATVQPAPLARGLRRVALERGVVIHEGTRVVEIDGERPGWPGRVGRATVDAAPVGRSGRPVRVGTSSAAGDGEVLAGSAVVAMNAWAAAWPSFGRRLVTWSSYIVLTEPIPERLAEIGWTGGEGLADARFTLHYLRTTPDGRIAIGGGGGRAGFGGRIGAAFTDDARSAARAAAGLRRLFPSMADVRIEDAWGGPIDISADHLPMIGDRPGGGRSTSRTGTRGTGSGRRSSPGGCWPAWRSERRRRRRRRSPLRSCAGGRPRAFPPEPFRYVGARVVREAIVRREAAEERGEPCQPVLREVTRLPRRLGYHLSPD